MGRRGESAQSGVRFQSGSLRVHVAFPHRSEEPCRISATRPAGLTLFAETAVQVSLET